MNHVAHSDQHLSTQSTLVLCLMNVNEDTGTFQNATGVEAGALSGQPGTGVTDKPETQGEDATATRHHFSKVLYTLTLYSKYARAMTFENSWGKKMQTKKASTGSPRQCTTIKISSGSTGDKLVNCLAPSICVREGATWCAQPAN